MNNTNYDAGIGDFIEKYSQARIDASRQMTSLLKDDLRPEEFAALYKQMCATITPEQTERLAAITREQIKQLADKGLLSWKSRLLEVSEGKAGEIDTLATTLAEQMDLTVLIQGGEDAVMRELATLQNIDPVKASEVLQRRLTPSSIDQISQNVALGFLCILDRENGDGDQWLLVAATTQKLIERETNKLSASLAHTSKPEDVASAYDQLFQPSYLPDAPHDQPATLVLSLSIKQ